MNSDFDLNAYLKRIGYEGERTPALSTLQALHRLHAQSIAFESLDPYLKRPVRLDTESLQEKLVRGGRGGYCFEQNLLLRHALEKLGFQSIPLAARVLWNMSPDTITPRTHMVLLVLIEGVSYVVDVGFGGLTLTAPLRLEADCEQTTPHESFRLLREDESFIMQAQLDGAWKPLYRFDLQRQQHVDYEVANWYVSTHPASRFVCGLVAARPDRDCRYALINNELTIRRSGEAPEKRFLQNVAELRSVLEEAFLLRLPPADELDAPLHRLVSASG